MIKQQYSTDTKKWGNNYQTESEAYKKNQTGTFRILVNKKTAQWVTHTLLMVLGLETKFDLKRDQTYYSEECILQI